MLFVICRAYEDTMSQRDELFCWLDIVCKIKRWHAATRVVDSGIALRLVCENGILTDTDDLFERDGYSGFFAKTLVCNYGDDYAESLTQVMAKPWSFLHATYVANRWVVMTAEMASIVARS